MRRVPGDGSDQQCAMFGPKGPMNPSRARRRSLGAGTGLARATRFGLVRRPRRRISGVVALSEAPPALSLSPRTAVLGSGGERRTSAHLCSAGWDLVPITPEGTRPVLREAH